MDSKRKLPADSEESIPTLKKESRHEPEDFNFEMAETPNFETKIELTNPVNLGDDIDPLAVKPEETIEKKDHEVEQNASHQKPEPQTPRDDSSPVMYEQIKIEEDETFKEELEIEAPGTHNPGTGSNFGSILQALLSAGPRLVLDDVTGRLISAGDRKKNEDGPTERARDSLRFGGSDEAGSSGLQDPQPSGNKGWFEFPQSLDQEPSSSQVLAEQQFPSTETSSTKSSDDSYTSESSSHASPDDQSSVSISMLLEHPFTSGFWKVDQQNGILIQPVPLPLCDRTREIWLNRFKSYPWLCKSNELERFFCWPCLLFGNPQNVWSTVSSSSSLLDPTFQGLEEALIDHRTTLEHQEAELLYITKKNIIHSLKEIPNLNQEIWKHLVRTVCTERKNKFVFENTLEFEAKITPMMQYVFHKKIDSRFAFKLSKVILAIATHQVKMKIIEDVKKAQYVALHFEDLSSTVKDGSWLVAIAQYADQNGRIHDRVIEFFEAFPVRPSKAQRTDAVPVEWVKHLFDDYKLNENTIGISYSATLVASKDIFLFNNRLMKWCPRALFFHPPAHSLYKSLLQAMSHSPFCRKYLEELHKICKFLNKYSAIFLFEKSNSSILPKTFDENFKAKFKSHFSVLTNIFKKVEYSLGYKKETRKEAWKYLKFLNSLDNRILMILVDRICSSVAELAEALNGPFPRLKGTYDSFQYLSDIRERAIDNLKSIVSRGIDDFTKDELLADVTPPLPRKFQQQVQLIVAHAREFLMQRFENWDQFRYTDSKLLERPLEDSKFPYDTSFKRLKLDGAEMLQLNFFLSPLGGAPLAENKNHTELLSCLAKDERLHEFPGLFKYLLFTHTIACDKRAFGNLLNSVYSFVEIKSAEDLTTAYLDGYFWQVEDISAVMEDPKFYQKALDACQSKVDKM